MNHNHQKQPHIDHPGYHRTMAGAIPNSLERHRSQLNDRLKRFKNFIGPEAFALLDDEKIEKALNEFEQE